LFSICLPIVQLGLFSLNLILFLASAVVLYRRRKIETHLAYENFAKNKVFKFWVRRFAKLFLLMGLWWPMIVICLFECNDMLNYTTQVWTQVLATFYKKPEKVDFEIPWHMYLISNLLAIQAVVTSILFVCNRKTWNAMKKTWPIVRLCYEDIDWRVFLLCSNLFKYKPINIHINMKYLSTIIVYVNEFVSSELYL